MNNKKQAMACAKAFKLMGSCKKLEKKLKNGIK